MDAPPVRGFRVHDENAVSLAQNKTLHSRNKSSPALSTLAAKGAFKMAAKRSAFGDISQTQRGNRALAEIQIAGKDNKVQLDKKPASLAQPAQKPLPTLYGSSVQPLSEIHQNSQIKKVLSKRATTIFKDYSTLSQPVQTDENVPRKSDSIIQAYGTVSTKVEVKPKVVESHPVNNILSGFNDLHIPTIPTKSVAPAVQVPQSVSVVEQDVIVTEEKPIVDTRLAEAKLLSILHNKENILHNLVEPVEQLKEPGRVEAFIEEEYDENYEDDGYVTARSFRSKPDNITEGNLTTVLVPKSGRDIERELDAAAAVMSALKEPADIDDEEWDISMVSEYKDEIFTYYHELENRLAPNPHYMDVQTEIQWSMRSVLIDWVVQVHDRFQLLPETLFLTVNIIDRFLSIKIVSINKLQLVGATALFVASKYEEVNCPTLKEMVFMVDNSYDEEEIIKAERFMLTLLGFDLGWPGPMSFLRRISTADDYDLETRTVAKYFLELTIMDERFLECPPSFVAAGAHCLARLMLNKGHWSTAHVHYSGYTYNQLLPLLMSMMECLDNPTHHHNAIYDKYCNKRFRGAAGFAREEIRRGFRLIDNQSNIALNFEQLCRTNSIFEYVYRDIPGYSSYPVRQY